MDQNIGNLIKRYRLRSGMSQLDLECEINAGFGSISKIENGKVDPTKETLSKIAHVLNLSAHETASLYSIDLNEYRTLISSVNEIHLQPDLPSTLQIAVNETYKHLKLHGAAVMLLEGDTLRLKTISQSWYAQKVLELVGFNLNSYELPINANYTNAILQAANSKRLVLVNTVAECIEPMLNHKTCVIMDKLINAQGLGAVPILDTGNKLIGIMPFSYNGENTVNEKLPILMGYCDAIAAAIKKFS